MHGGSNDKDKPWLLGESNAAAIYDLEIGQIGARKRRNGVSSQGARSDTPYGLWRAQDTTLAQESLFAVYSGRIYAFPGGGVVAQRACGVSMVDNLHMAVDGRWLTRFSTYVCSAHVHDSSTTLATRLAVLTDDNRFSQTASMAPRCAEWFQNRLWVLDNSLAETEETLWWSSLGDGLSYSLNNSIQPEPGVGGRGTALLGVRGLTPTLIVFKQSAVAAVEPYWGASSKLIPAAADALDTTKTNVRLISGKIGCVAARSVQFVPGAPGGDVYFLSRDGLRAISRAADDSFSSVSLPLSDPIRETIRRINWAYVHKAVSTVHDNRYYLGVPLDGATDNTHTLRFDLITQAWAIFRWTPKDFVTARMVDTDYRLWLQYNATTGDCSNSGTFTGFHVFKGLSGLLDPSGVPVIYQEDTRALTFDDLKVQKTWDHAIFQVQNDSTETAVFGVMYNVDGLGWVTAGSLAFGGSAQDPILGVTPLPWNATQGVLRTFRVNLSDAPPGYYLQLRYMGESDFGVPTILNVGLAARPILGDHDNTVA